MVTKSRSRVRVGGCVTLEGRKELLEKKICILIMVAAVIKVYTFIKFIKLYFKINFIV